MKWTKFLLLMSILMLNQLLAQTQQINVLAIRVEFQKDSSSLTTGEGLFDLTENDSLRLNAMDPPPHNKLYFEDHLTFLKNYYQAVSHGKVQIEFACFPSGVNESYILPHTMSYYNPFTTLDEVNSRLIELVRDAFEEAIKDPEIELDNYDAFIVFHAGVGQDLDVGLDDTPKDIPSIYINQNFLKKYIGNEYIELSNGFKLYGAAILPETESQLDYELAMNGMVVAQFGSFLGLEDMFNSKKRKTALGIFDIMDAGLFNKDGLLPSIPMAWHRIRENWVTPITKYAVNNEIFTIAPYNSTDSSVFKFPISNDEYFLVSMRKGKGVIIDSLLFTEMEQNNRSYNYRQILEKYFADEVHFSERGVLIGLNNYDLGAPGTGILIWHVDENQIQNQLSAGNHINDDETHQGVDLMEADGSQDIGKTFGFLSAGSGSENGYILDLFFDGNSAPMYSKNGNAFSPYTIPSSRSYYSNSNSGLELYDFSTPSDKMHFKAKNTLFQDGYPVHTSLDSVRFITSFSINNQEIFFVANDHFVELWNGDVPNLMDQYAIGDTVTFKNILKDPFDDNRFILITDRDVREALMDQSDFTVTNVLFSSNHPIQKDIVLPDKGLVLSSNNQFLYFTKINNVWQSQVLSLDSPIKNIAVYRDSSDIYRFCIIADSLYFYAPDYQELESIPFPSDVSAKDLRGLSARINGLPYVFLYDSLKVYQVDLAVNELKLFLTSEEFIQDAKFLLWYDRFPVLALLTPNQVKLVNLAGASLDYFPLNSSNFVFQNQFKNIIGSFTTNSSSEIYVGLWADALSGEAKEVKNGTINFYDRFGRPNYKTFVPLGATENKWSLLARSDNSGAMYVLYNGNTIVKLMLPLLIKNISLYDHIKKYNLEYGEFNGVDIAEYSSNSINQQLMPKNLAYNWPNPVQNGETFIRFYLSKDAHVSIKVFDEIGKLVHETEMEGSGGVNNEVKINVSSYSPGVYFASIKATAGDGETANKIIKIMVLK